MLTCAFQFVYFVQQYCQKLDNLSHVLYTINGFFKFMYVLLPVSYKEVQKRNCKHFFNLQLLFYKIQVCPSSMLVSKMCLFQTPNNQLTFCHRGKPTNIIHPQNDASVKVDMANGVTWRHRVDVGEVTLLRFLFCSCCFWCQCQCEPDLREKKCSLCAIPCIIASDGLR